MFKIIVFLAVHNTKFKYKSLLDGQFFDAVLSYILLNMQ